MSIIYQIELIVFYSSTSFWAFCLLSMRGLSGSTQVEGDTFLRGRIISRCEYLVVNTGSRKTGFFDGLVGPRPRSSWSRGVIFNLLFSFTFLGGSNSCCGFLLYVSIFGCMEGILYSSRSLRRPRTFELLAVPLTVIGKVWLRLWLREAAAFDWTFLTSRRSGTCVALTSLSCLPSLLSLLTLRQI